MLEKLRRILQCEDREELEFLTTNEENSQKELIEKYNKHFTKENEYFSLELVQLFSLRSIFLENANYSDSYPMLLLRKRLLFLIRLNNRKNHNFFINIFIECLSPLHIKFYL